MTSSPTDDPRPQKPRIFIGSSSEALPIVNRLVGLLSREFEVQPWNQSFTPGEYTLTALLELLDRVEAAIFVFAKDDDLVVRGESEKSARGNVLLEYGLFVSRLGPKRVIVLEEEGVGIPSDILGITTVPYTADHVTSRNAALAVFVDEVVRPRWADLRPNSAAGNDIPDGGLGYSGTIREEQQRIAAVIRALAKLVEKAGPPSPVPVEFDAKPAPLSVYADGLDRVERRFWTTTFLTSGFWSHPQGRILAANEEMLERVNRSGGQARRLFLLDQPPAVVIQAYKNRRILQGELRDHESLGALQDEHEYLKSSMKALVQQGFDVRVVFDDTEAYRSLPRGTLADPMDSELAIYDDFRVDVFEGGRHGVVHAVTSYSPAFQYFPTYLRSATAYFLELWNKAQPMGPFMDDLQGAVNYAQSRIDYESNWLAMYEYALPQEDEAMKAHELAKVEEALDEKDLTITRYLDVGTCTGRYPIRLRSRVAADGVILGVDEDYDCVRFAAANVEQKCGTDRRIEITQSDFLNPSVNLSGGFDLITCMLGTLSHFGWDRSPDHKDHLQKALTRMASLLSRDGVLFLGTWSEYACNNRTMLGIYRPADRARLAEWSPTGPELEERLASAGLTVVGRAQPDLRLDLTWCRVADGLSERR